MIQYANLIFSYLVIGLLPDLTLIVLLLHPIVTVSFPQMIKLVPIKNFCFPLCPDQHRGNGRSWYPRKAKLICNLQIPLIPSLLLDTNNSLLSVPTHLTKRLLPM